jgi:hypothetical protein
MADGAWDDPNVITALRPDSIPITISAGHRDDRRDDPTRASALTVPAVGRDHLSV